MSHTFKFTAGQRRILGALAHVACPPDVAALGCEARIVTEVELSLASFAPLTRVGILAALFALEWVPVVLPATLGRRFSALPRANQDRFFAACWHHRLVLVRQGMKGIKGLIAMAYYEVPEVKTRLGYAPEPWIAQVRKTRLERHADAILAHEAANLAAEPLVVRTSAPAPEARHAT